MPENCVKERKSKNGQGITQNYIDSYHGASFFNQSSLDKQVSLLLQAYNTTRHRDTTCAVTTNIVERLEANRVQGNQNLLFSQGQTLHCGPLLILALSGVTQPAMH